ncbi:MAG: recombinase family protein [Fibromonadaceae bacterium]|jgi:DNA invertase Pin-like site-specific DNA recombinase|nr:recombinase family protein [Fibromonadaceae bacterium]
MIYGYVRVSTIHQNVENGRFEVANFAQKQGFPIEKWVTEQISSQKDLKKRKLSGLLRKVRKGDVIIATEISRLGRNILEILEILGVCLEKECQVWTIKENYKLGTDIPSKVLAVVFGLVAEFERSLISSRTKEALARVKAEGKKTWAAKGNAEIYAEIGDVKREITGSAWQWGWQKGSCQNAWR